MGADTPAGGGDQKPAVKAENNNSNDSNRGGKRPGKKGFVKKQRFLGADPNLQGFVFEARHNRLSQVANFERVDERIRDQIGAEYHPNVLESIETGSLVLPNEPSLATSGANNTSTEQDKMKFKEQYSRFCAAKDKIEIGLKQVYAKYYGQCTEELRATLEEHPEFKQAHKSKDVLKLRVIMKKVTFHYRSTEDPIKTLLKSHTQFLKLEQGNMTITEYYRKFNDMKSLLGEMIGDEESCYNDHGLVEIICREKGVDVNSLDPTTKTEYLATAQGRMLAMHFIQNSEGYGDVVEKYDRDYLGGKNNYPTTLHAAYLLLKNWRGGKAEKVKVPGKLGLTFNVDGDEEGDALVNDGEGKGKGDCSRCGRPGHTVDKCFSKKHVDGTVLHIMGEVSMGDDVSPNGVQYGPCADIIFDCGDELEGLMFLQPHECHSLTAQSSTSSKRGIPISWLLLDNQSTVDVFSNGDLLQDIHEVDQTLTIRCNAGAKTTNWQGRLPGYGWVWYYPHGIANILSLSRVKERYRVTFDSAMDNCFHVHKDGKKIMKFKEATRRLYYFDTADRDETGTMLITTVENNKSKLSAYDYNQAEKARALQRRIGRPSTRDFIRYVATNLIPNCPVTIQDIKNAEFIWGPDIGSLKGKTVREQPPAIRVTGTDIPLPIMQHYKDVTLSADVMKVTGIPFLMTISKHIKFGSAGKLDSMRNSHIIRHFKAVIGAYVTRGFRVTIIIADNQFESMRGELADLHCLLHVVARDEHVPEVERYNRTIKERVRAQYNVLPFKHLPPIFVVEMVYASVFWRNMFALKGGVSKTMSPSEIVLNRRLDFNAHCKVEFGEYVQTHEEHDNSMNTRTIGAIATRPSTGDGAYYFISLATGRRINRRAWTPLPMPAGEVVPQVHRLARRANAKKKLTFTNVDGEDLDILYADLPRDEDDLELPPAQTAQAAGVGTAADDYDSSEDSDDEDDSDYDPADDEDSEDDESDDDDPDYDPAVDDDSGADSDDSDDDSDDSDDDDDDHRGDTAVSDNEEPPGVEDDQSNAGETPGVDNGGPNAGETPGVDDAAQNADEDAEFTGVDDDEPSDEGAGESEETTSENAAPAAATPSLDAESESDNESESNDSEDNDERTYGRMSLRRQPRREYNVFSQGGDVNSQGGFIFLHMAADEDRDDDEAFDFEETTLDEDEAEYNFLHDTLGWGAGLQDQDQVAESTGRPANSVVKLAEYLFLTEQMNWKKGLKAFAERGEEAIMKELKQIHDMEGFQPKHWNELTKEERAAALKYLMYLKEKRDGKIKGRGCADGRPQRLYTSKIETSSPTASLAGIMLTCMIDAFERRDVATVDIPGAFLQTRMPDDEKDVHVVLDGRMAELLAKISPETYQKYVHHRRGQAFIYCKLNVALYGTLKAALLFWKKLSKSLKQRGFEVNPYDWCIANKQIEGSQCTIVWHVDDLKISHAKASVIDGIVTSLKAEYGKVGEMTVRRGKIHDYLGMKLDFSSPGSFVVDMEDYLDEVLDGAPPDMDGVASTPAADHLFKTRLNVEKLEEERADLFHRITAQLLFVSQRARPDLRTSVSFLTKRVKSPDEDDWKKLSRTVRYIRKTKFLRMRIEAAYLDQNHWFIDGAFAVHDNMRGHTGGYMTFGKGMLDGTSAGQKINTTSSTECEVVGVHELMPALLWTRYFLDAQGYPLKPTKLHQDNLSSKLLETNGRASSSKRTRHMNIRYFFVADVLQRKHITIEYCPTDEMIADFFTKPLGGAKFRRFRNIIMNLDRDEHGVVNMDELIEIHHVKMMRRMDAQGEYLVGDGKNKLDESTIDAGISTQDKVDSQECVGVRAKRTNGEWAAFRAANKNNGGQRQRRTYAEVVEDHSGSIPDQWMSGADRRSAELLTIDNSEPAGSLLIKK